MTGPYIVSHQRTTVVPAAPPLHRTPLSRVAVETLDEARRWANELICNGSPGHPVEESDDEGYDEAVYYVTEEMPAEGGSVTLPDGSTITVEPVTYDDLVRLGLQGEDDPDYLEALYVGGHRAYRTILAAFNERAESEEAKR